MNLGSVLAFLCSKHGFFADGYNEMSAVGQKKGVCLVFYCVKDTTVFFNSEFLGFLPKKHSEKKQKQRTSVLATKTRAHTPHHLTTCLYTS